ncbi:MAG: hypothetical protein IDH49_08325 [Gammaproteobacteria bacterium]|nr:hypothetical protein [Gammaproteobacteria bacterium]
MKRTTLFTILFVLPGMSAIVQADDRLTFGLGIGAPYSGIGVNVGLVSSKDLKFLSLGRVGGTGGGGDGAWGAGAGWVRTDLFSDKSSKHGVGLYLGQVTTKRSVDPGKDDVRGAYGAGLVYSYFLSGIGRSGLVLGLTPAIAESGRTALWFQLGYQF